MILPRARGMIPVEVRQALRYMVALGQDVFEGLTGRADRELPPHRLRSVGMGDFRSIGENMVRRFTELGGLTADQDVLDIGCGTGRMAIPLTAYLNPDGSYRGLDIRPKTIEWCRRNITPTHPNFQFDCAELRNTLYARRGAGDPAEFRLPYGDSSFDFVFACSLFTHMTPPGARNYVREIARVLRPNGTCFTTWYVLNDETRKGAARNLGILRFDVDRGDYAVDSARVPEAALAYREPALRQMFVDAGLALRDPIHFGSWSGAADARTAQDVVIATASSEPVTQSS